MEELKIFTVDIDEALKLVRAAEKDRARALTLSHSYP